MEKVNKQELKAKIINIVDKLVDSADKAGDLNFFEIRIRHINRDLSVDLVNKYKDRVK
jgi:hypothetical protein